MSDSLRPHRWQPTRLPRPWDSPSKNTGVGCHFLLQCRKVKSENEVAQSCPTLRNPMDCSLPGSSIYGIFQARVLEWGAIARAYISACLFKNTLTGCFYHRHHNVHRQHLLLKKFLLTTFHQWIHKTAVSSNSTDQKTYVTTDFSSFVLSEEERHMTGKLKGTEFVNLPGRLTESF